MKPCIKTFASFTLPLIAFFGSLSAEPIMVPCAGGKFQFSSIDPYGNAVLPKQVTVAPFLISATEIRQDLYESITAENPSSHVGDSLPVEHVTYGDAVRFCNMLSREENLQVCYTDTGLDLSANGYRLPTEAEWEWAASAETPNTKISDWGIFAWDSTNSGKTSHPVGSKRANELGLYDMFGNVWEWCSDEPSIVKIDTVSNLPLHTIKGGSFFNDARDFKVPYLEEYDSNYSCLCIGFRVVRKR